MNHGTERNRSLHKLPGLREVPPFFRGRLEVAEKHGESAQNAKAAARARPAKALAKPIDFKGFFAVP
jgi:hypothetical protein